jgi:predicted Zn-ribbon and HTH transcriptional regulator
MGRTDGYIACDRCGHEFAPYELKSVKIRGIWVSLCPSCASKWAARSF